MSHTQIPCFSTYSLNSTLTTKNRFVLAPMTNSQSQPDGTLGNNEHQWLLRRARGGFGIIITCAAYVTNTGKAWEGQLGMHTDEMITTLKLLTADLKAEGSISIAQLFHGGVRCPSKLTGQQPVSASEYELNFPGFEKPRALTQPEIDEIVETFAHAAERAYKAGFDGTELHGANGYLITQFLSTQTNLRQDNYGGSLENRARFVREIMLACKKRVPANFLVGIRLIPEGLGLDFDETLQVAAWMKEDGADYVHLSLSNSIAPPKKYEQTSKKSATQYFRERLGPEYPLIAGGNINTQADANLAIGHGANLVYLARTAIGNPDWPKQAINEKFEPVKPPYTVEYLQQIGISEPFIGYLKSMPKGWVLV